MAKTTVQNERILVLGYHRIGAPLVDPWSLSVTPAHFAEHLQRICARASSKPLDDVVRLQAVGGVSEPTIVVTFDDGYADTLSAALPCLESCGIPATVFLTAGYIGSDCEFWWDALERLVLMPGSLPPNLRVTICGRTHQWTFDKTADYSGEACERHSRWGTFDEPPTERHKAYREMWTLMGPLREETRRDAIDELFAAAHLESTARETHRLLNRSEVLQLSCNNLIRFGAHSMTHSMLSSLDLAQQLEEIVGSKAALEALSGLPVTTFAYPYGQKEHYTDETVALVREASFKAACSNFPGLLTPHTDIFEIPRVQVYDCDGSQFDRLLDSWLA